MSAALLLVPSARPGERKFRHHFIDRALPGTSYGQTRLVDINKDGHKDLVMTENEIKSGKIGWLENVDGKGANFVERVILDNGLGGHEAVVADVDGDGDLDICSKLWRPRKDNANEGRNQADFVEKLAESKMV